jgi:hypothetical protein
MTEIDYTTISLISILSGFGGAIGGELAKALITYMKSPHNHQKAKSVAKKLRDKIEQETEI